MIGRRQFLLVAGACASSATDSLRAQAQPMAKAHRVGVLSLGNARVSDPDIAAFRERLGQIHNIFEFYMCAPNRPVPAKMAHILQIGRNKLDARAADKGKRRRSLAYRFK